MSNFFKFLFDSHILDICTDIFVWCSRAIAIIKSPRKTRVVCQFLCWLAIFSMPVYFKCLCESCHVFASPPGKDMHNEDHWYFIARSIMILFLWKKKNGFLLPTLNLFFSWLMNKHAEKNKEYFYYIKSQIAIWFFEPSITSCGMRNMFTIYFIVLNSLRFWIIHSLWFQWLFKIFISFSRNNHIFIKEVQNKSGIKLTFTLLWIHAMLLMRCYCKETWSKLEHSIFNLPLKSISI